MFHAFSLKTLSPNLQVAAVPLASLLSSPRGLDPITRGRLLCKRQGEKERGANGAEADKRPSLCQQVAPECQSSFYKRGEGKMEAG